MFSLPGVLRKEGLQLLVDKNLDRMSQQNFWALNFALFKKKKNS